MSISRLRGELFPEGGRIEDLSQRPVIVGDARRSFGDWMKVFGECRCGCGSFGVVGSDEGSFGDFLIARALWTCPCSRRNALEHGKNRAQVLAYFYVNFCEVNEDVLSGPSRQALTLTLNFISTSDPS